MKIEINHEVYNPIQACLNGDSATESQWLDMLNPVSGYDIEGLNTSYMIRDAYVDRIGYSIYTSESLDALAIYLKNKKVLELGSGSGFLSSQLEKRGVDIMAIDNCSTHKFQECFKRDVTGDALCYINENTEYTDIILSWPPYMDAFATDVFDKLKPGTTIWYLGEGAGGCCADDFFFTKLEEHALYLDVPSKNLNQHHVQFKGLHDYWQVYKKD
mgnify:CR=1 FL=1